MADADLDRILGLLRGHLRRCRCRAPARGRSRRAGCDHAAASGGGVHDHVPPALTGRSRVPVAPDQGAAPRLRNFHSNRRSEHQTLRCLPLTSLGGERSQEALPGIGVLAPDRLPRSRGLFILPVAIGRRTQVRAAPEQRQTHPHCADARRPILASKRVHTLVYAVGASNSERGDRLIVLLCRAGSGIGLRQRQGRSETRYLPNCRKQRRGRIARLRIPASPLPPRLPLFGMFHQAGGRRRASRE
jgi:hypothetical protein